MFSVFVEGMSLTIPILKLSVAMANKYIHIHKNVKESIIDFDFERPNGSRLTPLKQILHHLQMPIQHLYSFAIATAP